MVCSLSPGSPGFAVLELRKLSQGTDQQLFPVKSKVPRVVVREVSECEEAQPGVGAGSVGS